MVSLICTPTQYSIINSAKATPSIRTKRTSLKFSAKILCDNLNKTFKIIERLIDLFYKNRVVYFQYKGVRIPGQFTFPETEAFEKKIRF